MARTSTLLDHRAFVLRTTHVSVSRLKRALDALSADHRRAIFLAYVRKLPTSEIADRLGRSPNATSMLLLRAYRQLRRCFGNTESLGLQDSDSLEEAFGTDGT